MRLLVCNASPRAGKSNTDVLLDALLGGFEAGGGTVLGRYHLVRPAHLAEAARRYPEADALLLAFPLYVDALPAPGFAFVEALAPYAGRAGNPALLGLVQSGFPEALHSRPVEKLLEKLARRLGGPYLGTIVKGGVEGIQAQPPSWRRRIVDPYAALGEGLAREGRLDPALLARVAAPERMPGGARGLVHRAVGELMVRWFWNAKLKANGALSERDARPYAAAP